MDTKIVLEVLSILVKNKVEGIVTEKFRKDKNRKEWALVSKKPDARTRKRRVLKWFGTQKPTKEQIAKEEKRIQYFKHKG